MKFDDLDARMRVFETAADHCVLPGVHMVARLDGRGFTKLTKERHDFAKPFDDRFREHMAATVEHVMTCGFQLLYGYTQSDEISLLFHPAEQTFGRKTRKVNSVLAGEASARFSLLLGDIACFDCRTCELPRDKDVVDYFRWRQEDAGRNALSAHCYWMLRGTGLDERQATQQLLGLSIAAKNDMLFTAGTNFNALPPGRNAAPASRGRPTKSSARTRSRAKQRRSRAGGCDATPSCRWARRTRDRSRAS